MIEILPPSTLATLTVLAVGVALVLTCTRAGYPARFLWCALLRWRYTRFLWSIMLCPHCCSWWCGLGVALVFGHTIVEALQVAFTACAAVLILQRALQRDYGIAFGEVKEDGTQEVPRNWMSVKGVSLEPPEDLEDILGSKE